MIKVIKISKNCGICGKEMILIPCTYEKQFCSIKCASSASKKEKTPNTKCANCGKDIFKWPYQLRHGTRHYCDRKCKGEWRSKNMAGDNSPNWKGGIYNNRVQVLAHTSYRTWRAKLLENALCIFCDSKKELELHHIKSRKNAPERVRDESNVVPICAPCHDIFHSNSSKGGELRGTLKAILAHGNPQPSQSNVVKIVDWKVQRLTGEDITTNKPDTSAAPERDEIVWTCRKL